MDVQTLFSDYGFPAVGAAALVWFLWWMWNFVVKEIYPRIRRLHVTSKLIESNQRKYHLNLVRLSEKLETVLELKDAAARPENNDDPR